MKDAPKYHVDNCTPSEADLDWAVKFLYPDLREPYRLRENKQGYKTAGELIARARVAWQRELNDKRYYYTINDRPATEQEAAIIQTGMDKAFSNLSKVFDNIGSMFTKLRK